MECWVYLPTGFPSTKLPILCTNGSDLCLYVEGGNLKGKVMTSTLTGTATISAQTWTHVVVKYDNAGNIALHVYVTSSITVPLHCDILCNFMYGHRLVTVNMVIFAERGGGFCDCVTKTLCVVAIF